MDDSSITGCRCAGDHKLWTDPWISWLIVCSLEGWQTDLWISQLTHLSQRRVGGLICEHVGWIISHWRVEFFRFQNCLLMSLRLWCFLGWDTLDHRTDKTKLYQHLLSQQHNILVEKYLWENYCKISNDCYNTYPVLRPYPTMIGLRSVFTLTETDKLL